MTNIQISTYEDYEAHLTGASLKYHLTKEMARRTIARLKRQKVAQWIIDWTQMMMDERVQQAHEEVL